ncbi:MAG: dihydrodipicolinate synthase family protein [Deltaproteobacteria bacterium]|nr:dihydrodipicolinate synthase family protein [Deltaproteobacteria bacterium]
MAKIQVKGVIPPMITPFKENGDVDYDAHRHNMELWNESELDGYLVLGSNSEAAYLTEDEKIEMLKVTVRKARKGRIILAGTGMESTRETINLTKKAADAGADAVLVLTPFYYSDKMNDEALISFFSQVADNVTIPVLIYNVTKFTHINISARAVAKLSEHPNIIGMKDSSGNIPQLVTFKSVAAEDFNLIVGTASAWYPALTLGVKAGIMALANITPGGCTQVQNAYERGDYEEACKIYERLFPVNTAITNTYGVAGLKYAANLLGYKGGFVRSPLLPVNEEEKSKIRGILQRSELIA